MFLIQILFKIFIWKMVLSLGVLSFLPLTSATLTRTAVYSGGEQKGGDISQSGDQSTEEIIKNLPMAQKRNDLAPRRKVGADFNLKLSAESFLVWDEVSEVPLLSQEADLLRSIGSITKLLTALVFLKNQPSWDKEITIEPQDGGQGRLFLNEGEKVKVHDLFYATLVGSSNNAAMALARSTGLPLEEFVQAMNQEAGRLGLKNTSVVEPTGLDARNQSTAKEVALLLKKALKEPLIKKATTTKGYNLTVIDKDGLAVKRYIPTTNLLLTANLEKMDIEGGKTGFVDEAGHCFVVETIDAAEHRIIVVVLGANSNENRFNEARALAEWTYNSYLWPDESGYGLVAAPEISE